jgi:hypothetical protein
MKQISIAAALCLVLVGSAVSTARAAADPPKAWQDVRSLVARFNDAQNAHNLDVIGALLQNSPNFTWSAGGVVQRGHDVALDQITGIFQTSGNTWSILPDYGSLTIQLVSPTEADVTYPSVFKASTPARETVTTQGVVRLRAVKTPEGWRISSLSMDPAPSAVL